jgi:hypothetical protein
VVLLQKYFNGVDMSGINAKQIDQWISEIENVSECEALEFILTHYTTLLSDLIKDKIREQKELIKKFAPPLKIPSPDPYSIVSWVKKFVTGTVMPQLEAAIKLALQTVELVAALTRLNTALSNVPNRLRVCLVDTGTTVVIDSIGGIINEATSELTELLTNISSIQNDLEDILGGALTARIDTSSVPAFTESALNNLNDIQNQVKVYIDTPVVPQEVFSGSVEIAPGTSLVIQNGSVINVTVVEE